MSNMSYCRFENTYRDLVDCQEALDELGNSYSIQCQMKAKTKELEAAHAADDVDLVDKLGCEVDDLRDQLGALSESEHQYAVQLLLLCQEMVDQFDPDDIIAEDG